MSHLIYYLNLLNLLLMSPLCELYKILVVMPIPIKSHAIMGHAFVKLLLEAGHEVTYITGLPCNKSYKNFRQIDVSRDDKFSGKMMDKHILKEEIEMSNPKHFSQLVTTLFSLTLQHAEVNMLLKDTSQRFDLIISEWMFNEVYTGLAALYDCPFIWFSSTKPHPMMLQLIDGTVNPILIKDKSDSPSLMKDMYLYNLEKEAFINIFEPLMALRKKSLRSYDESRYIASLALVNSHASLDLDTSLPQNLKLIAGFHIDQDVEPLPKDLKSIMDNARHGVIYFSMGSYMESKDIPEVSSQNLIDMFSKLKQIVIWKLDLSFSNLPRNIHVLKWAPQQSILAHPNCILFITHGGLLSLTESVHFGVPIIGIPVFGDQFINVARAVEKGFAKKIKLSHSLAKEMNGAIKDILSNLSYRKKVKELSAIYNDRLMLPSVELVHWVNHAVHTGSAF